MSKNYLGELISIIGLFVFMHYYVTIDFLCRHLSRFNLDTVSILSWDDIQFPLAQINANFFMSLFLSLLIVSIAIKRMMTLKSNTLWSGISSICACVNKKQRKYKWIIYIVLILASAFSLALIIFAFISSKAPIHIIILVLLLCVTACIKYDMIYLAIIGTIFYMTTSIYRDTNQANNCFYSNDIIFNINSGETIKSDSVNNLIFFGNKYIVMQSDSSTVKLYPTSNIKDIEWIKR